MKNKKKLTLHNRYQIIIRELIDKNNNLKPVFRKAKFEKMRVSPYAFFRGSNHLYWADFYHDWRFSLYGGKEETLTWINGDAHIYNYGAYANHEGEAIFGMDDFDDSIVADYQYDLWRMAISIVLDCRNNGTFSEDAQVAAMKTFIKAYLKEITSYEADDIHKEVQLTSKTANGILKDFLDKVERKKSRKKMLEKWTIDKRGEKCFNIENKKLERLSESEYKALAGVMDNYKETLSYDFSGKGKSYFQVKDIARRLWSGTGSLGLDRFYILLEGDDSTNDDDIILDVKALDKPPIWEYMSKIEQNAYNEVFSHEGERYVEAFTALTEHPDRYLGWLKYNGQVFSVREKSPFKADFPSEKLKKEEDLLFMAATWGKLLATRHERASHRLNNDPYAFPKMMQNLTDGSEEKFINLVVELAFQYADCVYQDWKSFLEVDEAAEVSLEG